jgi:hypothetical protein
MKNSKPRRGNSSRRNFSGSRGGSQFNRSRSRSRNQKKFKSEKIDVNMFINKANPEERAEVFVPKYSFDDLSIHKNLKKAISDRGFTSPTPIQEKAIPVVLKGGDVIGLANTGVGRSD